jgi:transcriptional regulator with XRE-family HTH domain
MQKKFPEDVQALRRFGREIARLRRERGLTQGQLAELASTSQPAISRLERTGVCTSLTFIRVATALQVAPTRLVV